MTNDTEPRKDQNINFRMLYGLSLLLVLCTRMKGCTFVKHSVSGFQLAASTGDPAKEFDKMIQATGLCWISMVAQGEISSEPQKTLKFGLFHRVVKGPLMKIPSQ